MSANQVVKLLVKGINDDVHNCEVMQQLLVAQQQSLAQTDTERLTELNQQLNDNMSELAKNGRQRFALLEKLGLPADKNGMMTLFERLPSTAAQRISEQWQKLEVRLKQCKKLNDRNGQLLSAQQEMLLRVTGQTNYDYGDVR